MARPKLTKSIARVFSANLHASEEKACTDSWKRSSPSSQRPAVAASTRIEQHELTYIVVRMGDDVDIDLPFNPPGARIDLRQAATCLKGEMPPEVHQLGATAADIQRTPWLLIDAQLARWTRDDVCIDRYPHAVEDYFPDVLRK